MPKTLILGASENPMRYSNMAIKSLIRHGEEVVAIGHRAGKVEDVAFDKETKDFEDVDTVSLYLNPKNQLQYYEYIIGLKPRRIIFNPGTENPELEKLAKQQDIQSLHACTLVMLSTGQY